METVSGCCEIDSQNKDSAEDSSCFSFQKRKIFGYCFEQIVGKKNTCCYDNCHLDNFMQAQKVVRLQKYFGSWGKPLDDDEKGIE